MQPCTRIGARIPDVQPPHTSKTSSSIKNSNSGQLDHGSEVISAAGEFYRLLRNQALTNTIQRVAPAATGVIIAAVALYPASLFAESPSEPKV